MRGLPLRPGESNTHDDVEHPRSHDLRGAGPLRVRERADPAPGQEARACPGESGGRDRLGEACNVRRAAGCRRIEGEPDHRGEGVPRPHALLRRAPLQGAGVVVRHLPRPGSLRRRRQGLLDRPQGAEGRSEHSDDLQRGAAAERAVGRPRRDHRRRGKSDAAGSPGDGPAERAAHRRHAEVDARIRRRIQEGIPRRGRPRDPRQCGEGARSFHPQARHSLEVGSAGQGREGRADRR